MNRQLLTSLLLLSLSPFAFGDDTPLTPKQQVQAQDLKFQVQELSKKIRANKHVELSPALAMLSEQASRGVMTDLNSPFGLMPSTVFPLAILQSKQTFNKPFTFGGYFEADAQYYKGDNLNVVVTANNGSTSTTSYRKGADLYLTTVKLFGMANLGDWVDIFTSFQPSTNNATPTRFEMAFANVGNLSKNPLFLTVGKTYLPFGTFGGGGPWSSALTTDTFRLNETPQVTLGYFMNGLNMNLGFFAAGNAANNDGDFVYSINYLKSIKKFSYSLGAGYVNDIRGTNSGIGSAYGSSINGNRNAAYDFNGTIGYGVWQLSGEFDMVNSAYTNVAGGDSAGKMRAWMTSLSYAPIWWNQLTSFTLSYSATQNMNNVPSSPVAQPYYAPTTSGVNQGFAHQWIAAVTRQFAPGIYIGPEFQYATLYSGQHTSTTTVDLSAYF